MPLPLRMPLPAADAAALLARPSPWHRRRMERPDMEPFRPVATLALVVTALLALDCLFSAASILSAVAQLGVLERIEQGTIDDAEIAANDAREAALGGLGMALYLAAGVAWLVWFHRAYRNLPHFGHTPEQPTGWAVGAWITPILNLFRPYQIAREIWHASDPGRSHDMIAEGHPPLLAGWWTLWTLGNLIGQVSFRMSLGADDLPSIRDSTAVQLLLDVVNLVNAPIAIMVVRELTRRQDARAAQVALGAEEIAKTFE